MRERPSGGAGSGEERERLARLRQELLREVREALRRSVTDETLIIQAVTTLEQLEEALGRLVKKGREWYAFWLPEAERFLAGHEPFLEGATEKGRGELLALAGRKESIGGNLRPEDVEALVGYLVAIRQLIKEKKALTEYLTAKVKSACPNLALLAGALITAKLLSHAGGLQRLATLPASTIQLLGAERALFRHLRDKQRHNAPKYGLLYQHPLVQGVPQRFRGRAARALADKLALAARLDYFRGGEKAGAYKEELERRFGVRW